MNFLDCHEEQIHIPGYIQSFGYLIGLDEETKTIKFYSENLHQLFRFNEDIFGKRVEELPEIFPQILSSGLFQNLDQYIQKESDYFEDTISIKWDFYHFIVYRFSGNIFLEFEKVIKNNSVGYISKKYDNANDLLSSEEIWKNLVNNIHEAIGYDRIMVYKFLSDGSGKVIAERKREDLESYMHLHYPESDIPRQARALYLKKRERIFSNVYEENVAILSKTEEVIDLTYSSVRAMSPIHAQYIKNAGASSSFSTSIIINNQLWGLVTCQNVEFKHIDLLKRMSAEVITTLAAHAYMSFKSKQNFDDINYFTDETILLKSKLRNYTHKKEALFENIEEIKKFIESDGFALILGEEIFTLGEVPEKESIKNIANWFVKEQDSVTYQNRAFYNEFGEKFNVDTKAAGILMTKLEEKDQKVLIWFRKEYQEYINWAGYEEKKPENIIHHGEEKLMVSPRKSFETYVEEIKGKAKPWQNRHLMYAEKLAPILIEILMNIEEI